VRDESNGTYRRGSWRRAVETALADIRPNGFNGCSLPTGFAVRLAHETLGKVRAVIFGIVLALVLIAYALHRLR